jgi:hypothetical protein
MMRWILTVEINEAPCPDSVVIAEPSLDQRALVHVVRGILNLSGMKFDAEGRLI